MRQNLPVNANEYAVPAGVSIVSKTDLNGIITYANDAFVEISGFARHELVGQPHNLVRHPDMPEQAFAHLWATLKKGSPWKGIVKNRRKDGSFYWVKAVVVPIRKGDATVGYMSVREAATRSEISAAEARYARMRVSGSPLKENPLQRLLTIKTGFTLGVLFVIGLMLAGGLLGITGLQDSSAVAAGLYHQRIGPMTQANRLDSAVHELRGGLAAYYMLNAHGEPEAEVEPVQRQAFLARLLAAEGDVEKILLQLQALSLPAEAGGQLAAVGERYGELRAKILLPLRQAIEQGHPVPPLQTQVPLYLPYFKALHAALGGFQQALDVQAASEWQALQAHNDLIRQIALFGIAVGILVVVVVGRFFLRDIVQPLESAIEGFDRIAQGDLTGEVEVFGKGETGHLIRASAVMQMHLKVITDEISTYGRNIHDHCMRLNGALFEISDHSEIQHDQLSEARNFLSLDFAADLKSGIANLQQQLVLLRVTAGDLPELDAVQEELDKIVNLSHLQTFALEDFVGKIDQILDLVVENRQDTQEAYAMSEHLQAAAHQMNELVSYFTTRKEAGGK
ncbi:PAS domain-containing methyl-accepting chemotaxis protein [Dechloromonas sp. ZY10]|uniref:methyl-accepting chemotaxis protein n=1 Tax=Dechloromonas aquae TaxID=2664436 RepID=UPI0035285E01